MGSPTSTREGFVRGDRSSKSSEDSEGYSEFPQFECTTTDIGPDMTITYTRLLKFIGNEGTHRKVASWRSKLDAGGIMNQIILSVIATFKQNRDSRGESGG